MKPSAKLTNSLTRQLFNEWSLVFKLSTEPSKGLFDKTGDQPYNHGLEDIKLLSPDFLNMERKIKDEARKVALAALGNSGWKYAFIQIFLPILLTLLLTFIATIYSYDKELRELKLKTQQEKYKEEMELKIDSLKLYLNSKLGELENGKWSIIGIWKD